MHPIPLSLTYLLGVLVRIESRMAHVIERHKRDESIFQHPMLFIDNS